MGEDLTLLADLIPVVQLSVRAYYVATSVVLKVVVCRSKTSGCGVAAVSEKNPYQ